MSCFSKVAPYGLMFFMLAACGFDLDAPKRKSLTVIPPGRWSGMDRTGPGVDVLERDLYYLSQGTTACDYLMEHGMETKPRDGGNYFRILRNARAKRASLWELFPVKVDLIGDDGQFFDLPATVGNKNVLMLASMEGSIRLDENPFYEMALMAQSTELPNRQEFIKLAEEELKASPIRLLGLLGLKTAWITGALNPYDQRNLIIRGRLNTAFPGLFASAAEEEMSESLTDVLIRNSLPTIELLAGLPGDSRNQLAAKEELLKLIFKRYQRLLPLFPGGSWNSYFEDSRWSLSLALRSLKSPDLIQQACGSALLQRAFAQMISIMGYDRPPVEANGGLIPMERFLMHPESTYFRGCIAPGSFIRRGRYAKLIQNDKRSDFIDNKPGRESTLRLADAPRTLETCTHRRSIPILADTPERMRSDIPAPRGYADLHSKISMAGAAGYYFMALNPGASWWRTRNSTLLSIPFTNFKGGIPALRAGGGYLASQSLALSLGLINLILPDIEAHHLVMIDADRKETDIDDKILGIRLSNEIHKKGSGGIIESRVETVSLFAELVFKFHEALKDLASWKTEADRWVKIRSEAERHPDYRLMIKNDYETFIKSLFGDPQNLQDLVETGPESARKQIDDLRLALALHLARFSVKKAEGGATCYASLVTNLDTGVEEGFGTCTAAQYEVWHRTMQLVGTAFNSPIYLNDGLMPEN